MKPIDNICILKADGTDQNCIERAAEIIRHGGVVVFPTRGLYGLGADALNDDATERVFDLKQRDRRKPLLALIANMASLEQVAPTPDAAARYMMRSFWPGGVTFVIPAKKHVGDALTGGSGKIGVRIPAHPIAATLVKAVGGAVTGTSANLSGESGCAEIKALAPELIQGVDLILDVGILAGGAGSTVVDICGADPVILRQGSVAEDQIMGRHRQYLSKRIDIGP